MRPFKNLLRLNNKQKGASLLEYALLASLIAVVCLTAITSVGRNVGYTSALAYAGVACKKASGVGSYSWAQTHVKLVRSGSYGTGAGTDPDGVMWFLKCKCSGVCE